MVTICLNMIVKNESAVIKRSLSSVKRKIDYWVILDTGSTDGTQELIRSFLHDIPGELHERPWVNFEHNRNEALALAINKADYLLFIDADEEWIISEDFDKDSLNADFYAVKNRDQHVDLHRISLIKTHLPWIWKGVLHEEITCSTPLKGEVLPGVVNYGLPRDGYRARDPERYRKDAAILEEALAKDPSNHRYVFFLAQSYAAAGELALSLKYYKKSAEVGVFPPEVFWSLFSIATLQQDLNMDPNLIIQSYCNAFIFDPTRAEPLHHLAAFYQKRRNYVLAYIISKIALELPPPTSLCYVVREVYDYSLLITHACAAHSLHKVDEAKQHYLTLLSKPNLPQHVITIAQHNLAVIQRTS
ncbi:MAG: glycosyltransferase [Chlamydiales bacterium]|nr:glycosyltransferase [Chlamydiales bacterium]